MEVLLELIAFALHLLFIAAVHGLKFLFILLRAGFSPRYRARLRQQWYSSRGEKCAMVLGAGLYLIAITVALCMWIPWLWRGQADPDPEAEEQRAAMAREHSQADLEEMEKRRKQAVAVEIIKSLVKHRAKEGGWEERTEEGAEGRPAPPDAEPP